MYIIEHRIVCVNPYESSVVDDIVWCIWNWSTHLPTGCSFETL